MTPGEFQEKAGWGAAKATKIAGDASPRTYVRLTLRNQTAILMQDPEGDVQRFVDLSIWLGNAGLSAPKVLASAPSDGFALLEDFGERLFASCPAPETDIYSVAAKVLTHLHTHPAPEFLSTLTQDIWLQMLEPFFTKYLPYTGQTLSAHQKRRLKTALGAVYTAHMPTATTLVLRDYHAENLIWLPDRHGVKRAGLLDFQDALIGPRAYDLASLVLDARRDVGQGAAQAAVQTYASQTGEMVDAVETQIAILGLQRNLRILGIFVRLATERQKPGYLALMPRVLQHLHRGLDHPALADVAPILSPYLQAGRS